MKLLFTEAIVTAEEKSRKEKGERSFVSFLHPEREIGKHLNKPALGGDCLPP